MASSRRRSQRCSSSRSGPGWGALAIFAVYGACSALITLPLWDLAAWAAPPGYEGVGYAAMMSALNLAQSFADVVGSWLHDRHGMQFGSLVWLNTGSSLAFLLVRFVPAGLLDGADRRSA